MLIINLAIRKKDFVFKNIKLEILLKDEIKIDFQGDFLVSGKQIGLIIGYKNTRDEILNHVYDEDKFIVKNSDILKDKTDAVQNRSRKLNNRGETFINESGMY